MGDAPRVSVIIPTHNRAALLPRAVDSVLAQTYDDFELLIVDDCSTDDTPAVVAAFADPRVRALRHDANRGQSAAVNTGLAEARGEYAAFLDDDDEFTLDNLAARVAALDAAPPEVALVYGWIEMLDDASGETRPGSRLTLEGAEAFEYALEAKTIAPTSALLVRTDAARHAGGYDERLATGNDAYFTCCILANYGALALPQVVVRYHENHGAARMTDAQRESADRRFALHMETFAVPLERRPKTLAAILRTRAVLAMERGRAAESLRWTLRAFRRRPLVPANLRHALRLARVFVFYATPLSRYREWAKAVRRALRRRRG
ncbi:MAG: glycosyltransferase family 2 protein [Dehalococcoidia bacterium]|nr:glycosyltransferase family 2 protein [Dehalococcoidia bacterium]